MNNSNVSFTSKIAFIDGKQLLKLEEKAFNIDFHHNAPNMIKCDHFCSNAIRTCTGGGIYTPHKGAVGFHFWDDKINYKNFNDIIAKMFRWEQNPQRGILIGSKELPDNPYSLLQFQKFKKVFDNRIKYLTVFEKHKCTCSESSYHYDLNTDTWSIATGYKKFDNGRYNYVKSLKDLREAFDNIKIAEGDILIINGKTIKHEDAPDLFNTPC